MFLIFDRGIGISIISHRPCEELVFITFDRIKIEGRMYSNEYNIFVIIEDIQIDNQLFETTNPNFLYTCEVKEKEAISPKNAMELVLIGNTNNISKIYIRLKPIALNIEDRLVLKLLDFLQIDSFQENVTSLDDYYCAEEKVKNYIDQFGLLNATRYSISDLQIDVTQIKLSISTTNALSSRLLNIKNKTGLTFVKLEDAIINFEKFVLENQFETIDVYINSLKMHYLQELKWQAATILGSVDFLGDPIGFANDITEGFSGLLFEGSVKSLIRNVTHGISNSAAKFTLTLSKGLEKVIPDEQYSETRQKFLEGALSSVNPPSDHIIAGLKGFGLGLFGGATSIIHYSYIGIQTKGIQGLITGFGKGIVGTVTKPIIGLLDLTSETAHAVKESSRSLNETLPSRKRLPRCTNSSAFGLLPRYSTLHAIGQQHLYVLNQRNFKERLLIYEANFCDKKSSKLRLIVTTENVWIFSKSSDTFTLVCCYSLSDILSCHPLTLSVNLANTKIYHYIEFCLAERRNISVKRPRVRCQSEEMAEIASRQVSIKVESLLVTYIQSTIKVDVHQMAKAM